jgi:hypothetical protein
VQVSPEDVVLNAEDEIVVLKVAAERETGKTAAVEIEPAVDG